MHYCFHFIGLRHPPFYRNIFFCYTKSSRKCSSSSYPFHSSYNAIMKKNVFFLRMFVKFVWLFYTRYCLEATISLNNSPVRIKNKILLVVLLIGHSLYRSANIVRVIKSRRLRWAGHVARMEEGRSAFKILTGKPTGKRPLGRPRRRWEDNIRMDLEEMGINRGIGLIRLRIGIIGELLWIRH